MKDLLLTIRHYLIAVLILICLLPLLYNQPANSQRNKKSPAAAGKEQLVQVHIPTSEKSERIVGLLFTNNSVEERQIISSTIAPDGSTVVTFSIPEISEGSAYVSAIMTMDNGQKHTGLVRTISGKGDLDSFFSISTCPQLPSRLDPSKLGTIEELVSWRARLRALEKAKVAQALDRETLQTIHNLERELGFASSSELSPESDPLEIIKKLSKILLTIKGQQP